MTGAPRLCVPVCVRRAEELHAAVARAAELADVIELRLDCLADDAQLAAARTEIDALLATRIRPFILTFRATEQGGRRTLDESARVRFWQQCRRAWTNDAPRPDYVDIELELLEAHGDAIWPAGQSDDTEAPVLICSHHDFASAPADLLPLYERMTRTPAHILKIAVRATDATNCLPLFRLLAHARREGRALIAIAMGAHGLYTRVLAPAHGALFTYGALDAAHATAPGQITATELRDLYRLHALDAQTDVYGLCGAPVAHSLSPHIHNAAFAAKGLNKVYIPFEVRDVAAFIRQAFHPRARTLDLRLRGLSVTAPHKQTVSAQLDELDDAAREIGAVNTILCNGARLRGYNTDALAALTPLEGLINLHDARVAIIGAGGAARAVLWALRRAGAHTTVFARNVVQAHVVVAQFGAVCLALNGARFADFDLVVNATPLGTRGHNEDETPATAAQLAGARAAYDLVYNPAETRFMREARAAGCEVIIGGLHMLIAQASVQFKLWTGSPAPFDVMRAAAEKQLSEVGG
jgi:3-dehydroquinate dehydratase / shikimate dehydrogenase